MKGTDSRNLTNSAALEPSYQPSWIRATASGHIFTFVTSVNNVDAAIAALGIEVTQLSSVLDSISDSFRDISLANAALSSQTGHETKYWTNVKQSMGDCKATLEDLVRVLETVKTRRNSGVLGAVKGQISFAWNSGEIASLKQKISAYRQTMDLSLQLISVYVSLSTAPY